MRQLLIRPDANELVELNHLMNQQYHIKLVLWALDCAKELLLHFESYDPLDFRPRIAIEKGYEWSRGIIKMSEAKKAILASHQAATDHKDNLVVCALARAIGQAVSTIHVRTHAQGMVIYGITAFLRTPHQESDADIIQLKCDWFYQKLLYWQNHINEDQIWAPFLLKDTPLYRRNQ